MHLLRRDDNPQSTLPLSSNKSSKEPILTRNFVVASTANLFTVGSFTVLLATLPLYVVQAGVRQSEVGLVIGIFAIAALLVRPFAGTAVDIWGVKRLMLLGSVGIALSPLLYIISTSLAPMIGVRLFQGVAFSVMSTGATALIADIAPPTRRGEAVGYFGMSNNVAMAAGPALGMVVMASTGFTTLFIVACVVGVVSLAFSALVREPSRKAQASPMRRPVFIVRSTLLPTSVFYCFALLAGAIVTFVPLFAAERGLGNSGLFFTVQALVGLVLRSVTGQLSDRFGRGTVAIPGLLLGAVSVATLSQASSMPMFLGAAALYALSFSAVQPALMALVIDKSGPQMRGAAMGTYMLAMDAGVGSGALLGGLAADVWGYSRMYMFIGIMPLIGAGLFLWARRRTRRDAPRVAI